MVVGQDPEVVHVTMLLVGKQVNGHQHFRVDLLQPLSSKSVVFWPMVKPGTGPPLLCAALNCESKY